MIRYVRDYLLCVFVDSMYFLILAYSNTTFSSFGCFVFDLGVFVFEFVGASFSSFRCFVFEIWVLRASVFVFECFVFETTLVLAQSVEHVTAEREVTGSFPGGRTNIQRNEGTPFALQAARPSRGSDDHVKWRSRLQ